MRNDAPEVVVREVQHGVRAVAFRRPFRFGAATVTACPQVFVRVALESRGRSCFGCAAELAMPRWFDKRAARTLQDNVDDLVGSLALAAEAYAGELRPASAFGLFERHHAALAREGARRGWTALSAGFGAALLDRAVLDALCRSLDASVFDAVRRNAVGLRASALAPDLRDWDWTGWLASLRPLHTIEARHTVGLLDALTGEAAAPDALPANLVDVMRRHGQRLFKIKLGGDPPADLERLAQIVQVLEAEAPAFRFSLDGNEQYRDAQALQALFAGLAALPLLRERPRALLYLEQPLPRETPLEAPLPQGAPAALLIDEADDALDAFVRARRGGWTGVSSKLCKGLYKSLVNAARCAAWNGGGDGPFFMSAEDLTCQAGIAVQQDLAFAALLGLEHAERNGHHYVDGFGEAPPAEQAAFAAAHPDLYESASGRPRLRVEHGRIRIDSLFAPGFAHTADPAFESLSALGEAPLLVQAATA